MFDCNSRKRQRPTRSASDMRDICNTCRSPRPAGLSGSIARATALALSALTLILSVPISQAADDKAIILQSTTSTANSGLYDAILPLFTEASGITVNVVAVGTGQAIKNAENGDGDVLLVHAKAAEEQFVADGYGVERFDVMYNDFVIVGPQSDPAGIAGTEDVVAALSQIASSGSAFASRGDDSGTHKKELALWAETEVDVNAASGSWYRETGSGMGATLNVAVGMDAYALTDRGTWIAFANKGDLSILVEGADDLFNQYGVILVDPSRHSAVDAESAQAFIDWIIGPVGQAAINDYTLSGEQLFFPNANLQ